MSETDRTYEWRDGRMVNPAIPRVCIHFVGVTPGLWCGACNVDPTHPARAAHDPQRPPDHRDEEET